MPVEFTEEAIQRVFGAEAAESEDPERLKQYYFRNKVFDKVIAPLPLRILVGHKGVGKSALFKVAVAEERDRGHLPIFIRPDDIAEFTPEPGDFLKAIKQWKVGLQAIIGHKTLHHFGVSQDSKLANAISTAGVFFGFLKDTLEPYSKGKVDLTPVQKGLITKFLKNASISVYIDDLDRGWQAKKEDIVRLSALVNALRDLASENQGLRFKLSLRTDVYYLLRTSDESTDKFEQAVIWYTWTNHEILALLAKRIETFFSRPTDEDRLLKMRQVELAEFLKPVIVPLYKGQGKWHDVPTYKVLMSLIRKRPRDIVKLCSMAARHARDENRLMITTDDIRSNLEEYSQGRLQDTINEFKSELPDLERLVLNMKPSRAEKLNREGYIYKTDQLLDKIKRICEQGEFHFQNGQKATPKDLAHFLFKINFLTARKRLEEDGEIDRKHFEENKYLIGKFADFGYDWEIHPAYRWALQPDRIEDIYSDLELTCDKS